MYVMSSGSVCGGSWDFLCVELIGSSMCVEFSRISHPFKTRISHIQPSRNIPPIYSLHTCTHLSTHLSQRDNTNSQFHTNNRVTEYRSHSTITNACIIYISHRSAATWLSSSVHSLPERADISQCSCVRKSLFPSPPCIVQSPMLNHTHHAHFCILLLDQ